MKIYIELSYTLDVFCDKIKRISSKPCCKSLLDIVGAVTLLYFTKRFNSKSLKNFIQRKLLVKSILMNKHITPVLPYIHG